MENQLPKKKRLRKSANNSTGQEKSESQTIKQPTLLEKLETFKKEHSYLEELEPEDLLHTLIYHEQYVICKILAKEEKDDKIQFNIQSIFGETDLHIGLVIIDKGEHKLQYNQFDYAQVVAVNKEEIINFIEKNIANLIKIRTAIENTSFKE